MVKQALVATFALSLGVGWALPSRAQETTSAPEVAVPSIQPIQPVIGPTRLFVVPRADILPAGQAVTSANLQVNLGAPARVTPGIGVPAPTTPGIGLGFGYPGNAVAISNQMAMGDLFQLDTGITGYATTPWQGRLDLAGKLGLLQEKLGAIANLAGSAGAALNVDVNGTPSLGFNLGVPISKTIGFTPMNRLTLVAYPNWGSGLVAPNVVSAGIVPGTRFAVGLGGALTLTDTIALIADTSLLPGAAGAASEGSNLGVRFGFSPLMAFDLFARMPAGVGIMGAPSAVGAGLNWQY